MPIHILDGCLKKVAKSTIESFLVITWNDKIRSGQQQTAVVFNTCQCLHWTVCGVTATNDRCVDVSRNRPFFPRFLVRVCYIYSFTSVTCIRGNYKVSSRILILYFGLVFIVFSSCFHARHVTKNMCVPLVHKLTLTPTYITIQTHLRQDWTFYGTIFVCNRSIPML